MSSILVEQLPNIPVARQQVELVERKGVGHPDSICDAIMEAVSVRLSQVYLEVAGQVLHHNIDKGLLVAGQTTPALGGGRVEQPMRLIFGDRATTEWQGRPIPVAEIAVETARQWIREHLRFVDPERHVVYQNELKPGSPELTDIFQREKVGANDTSAAVGYAPLTETERLVLLAERTLNDPAFKAEFPEAGEDVKVMGVRQGRELVLTVALAFVDRFVPSEERYFQRKEAIRQRLQQRLEKEMAELDRLRVDINTLDQPDRGLGGMYLTVLGTSAEAGDSGQVGRGNRVNGVITLNRPTGTEAAAGKNPVSHVGKIYTLLTHQIADRIHQALEPVEEVTVWLCSQIGQPIDQPLVASAQVILAPGVGLAEVEEPIQAIIQEELAQIRHFTQRLIQGELKVW